jgi:hypothetical protein
MRQPKQDRRILEALWEQMTDSKLRLDFARYSLTTLIHDAPVEEIATPDFHVAYHRSIRAEILALQEYVKLRRIYSTFLEA